MKDYNLDYKLVRKWSDTQGKYMYTLLKNGTSTARGNWSPIAEGDLKWANRIAEHYDIEVPQIGENYE